MKKLMIGLSVLFIILISGCANTTIPLTSNINDFVMLSLKTNRQDSVSWEIISYIQDGDVVVLNQEETGTTGRVVINEGVIIQKMINEYMYTRFSKISENGDIKIKITISEFTLKDYNTDSSGTQALKILFAPTYIAMREPRIVSAKIIGTLDIINDNEVETKNFIVSSEEHYIGQFTSEESKKAFATCTNNANNKLLMQINAFFEEVGI